MSSTKTARWLDLIAFLLHHRFPVTREEIFDAVSGYGVGKRDGREKADDERALESARRMFERDKDELRGLGLEIETLALPDAADDEAATGYRLKPSGVYLPYLEFTLGTPAARRDAPYAGLARLSLSHDELSLLDRATQRLAARKEFPLSQAAASARLKLEFDLPLPTAAVERALAHPLGDDGERALDLLQRAVGTHTAVRCRYYAIGRDAEDTREIEPYGLFFTWSRWYTVARARDRDALRIFRVDRMRDVQLIGGKGARFRVPESFDIKRYLGRSPWELAESAPETVRVRFAFPESRWVQAREVGRVIEPTLDDGGAVLEFDVSERDPFLRWLLTFREQVEVLSPDDVKRALEALRAKVAAVYA